MASRYWAQAAERAYATLEADRGLRHAHRGLALATDQETRHRLLGALCELHYVGMTSLPIARTYAEEIVRTGVPGNRNWVKAMLVMLVHAAQERNHERFGQVVRDIIATEMHTEAADLAALLITVACYMLDRSGLIPLGHAMCEKMIELVRMSSNARAMMMSALLQAARLGEVHQNPWDGLRNAQTAKQWSQSIGSIGHQYASTIFEGMNLWFLGANVEARQSLQPWSTMADELGPASAVRAFALAWVLADLDLLAEARVCAMDLVGRSKARSLVLDESRGHWVLSEIMRRAGEFENAEVEIQIARTMGAPLDQPGIHATLANIWLARGQADEALVAAKDGLARLMALGGASGFFRNAFLFRVHAESLDACGRHEEAVQAIQGARKWIFDIHGRIAEEHYRRSFLENVPENRQILELSERWGTTDVGAANRNDGD